MTDRGLYYWATPVWVSINKRWLKEPTSPMRHVPGNHPNNAKRKRKTLTIIDSEGKTLVFKDRYIAADFFKCTPPAIPGMLNRAKESPDNKFTIYGKTYTFISDIQEGLQ